MEVEKLQKALRQSQESNRRLSEQLVNSVDRFTELSSQLSLARKRIEELTAELAAKKAAPRILAVQPKKSINLFR